MEFGTDRGAAEIAQRQLSNIPICIASSPGVCVGDFIACNFGHTGGNVQAHKPYAQYMPSSAMSSARDRQNPDHAQPHCSLDVCVLEE